MISMVQVTVLAKNSLIMIFKWTVPNFNLNQNLFPVQIDHYLARNDPGFVPGRVTGAN